MPSREQVAEYQRTARNLADNAGLSLKRQVRAYLDENPGATVAEVREFAKSAVSGVVTEFSQASTVLAEELYAAEFGSLPSGYIESVVSADEIDAMVRYRVCDLVDGDIDGFLEGMARWTSQSSFSACNTRTLQLARGKKSKAQMQRERRARRKAEHTTWFARVPSGVNTCTWCAMLASRGYVYWTEETAGKFSKWHDNCRCTVVATTKKGGIEGYDPTEWTYRWRAYEELDADQTLTYAQKRAAKNLVSLDGLSAAEAAARVVAEPVAASPVFLNKSSELYRRMSKVDPLEGYYDVMGHSDGHSLIYGDLNDNDDEPGTAFTMSELRDSILADQSYSGEPIRVVACGAGREANGLAQRLADVMGVDVLAPTTSVYVDFDGAMVLAETNDEYGAVISGKIPETGKWVTFSPRGSDGRPN